MNLKSLWVCLMLTFALVASDLSPIALDNDAYVIEQAIDDNDYFQIGFVNLRQLKQSQNAAQYQNLELSSLQQANQQQQQQQQDQHQFVHSTQLDLNKLDRLQLEQIEANTNNENSILKMRLCKRLATPNLNKCYASTFTYLRNLLQSGLTLNLTIYTGINNHLNSISIKTSSSNPPPSISASRKSSSVSNDQLTIHAIIQNIKQAQQPDTESYLEKIRIEKEQKEKSAQSGNESFLSKYWIYIVPFVIIMFLMNIVNPEAAAGGGGGGAR